MRVTSPKSEIHQGNSELRGCRLRWRLARQTRWRACGQLPNQGIRLRGSRCCGVIGSSGRARGPAFSTRDSDRILTGTVKPSVRRASPGRPPKLIERDLDNGQRSPGFLPLTNPHHHAFGATGRADSEIGLNLSAHQEAIMRQFIRAGAITLAIFSSVGLAAGQNAPSQTPGTAHADLTAKQQQTLSQGLASSPSQSAPIGAQPQVGDKVPDSMTAQSLPSNVTDQVPEVKKLLFVKLPDRVLLIDPDNKVMTELVMDSGASSDTTTGSSSGSSERPSR